MSYTIDPDAVLDFAFDWKARTNWDSTSGLPQPAGDWLTTGETITTKVVTVSAGLTLNSSSETGGKVTAWVSGANPVATEQTIACRITTNQGRTDERTITLIVANR